MVVGIELEEEVGEVNEDEDDRGTTAELEEKRCFLTTVEPTIQPLVESGGNDQGDDRNCHQGRIELGGHWLEFLGAEPESTDDKSHTQDEQHITEQTSKKGALDEGEVAFAESDSGDNEFDDISQGCVQQSADGLAGPQCDLFGSETQKGGERNDSESGDDEDGGVGLVSPM
jgi:hypothetical protein